MKNKAINVSSFVLVIATIFLSAQSAQAEDTQDASVNKAVSNVVTYDDGIKISDFADNTGFRVEGAGVVFTYNTETKVMSCSNVNGSPSQFTFDQAK